MTTPVQESTSPSKPVTKKKKVKCGFDPLNMIAKEVQKEKEAAKIQIQQPQPKEQSIEKKAFQEAIMLSDLNIAFMRKFYTDLDFIASNSQLLPCENIESYEKVSYRYDDSTSTGLLVLTKFRIIFKFQDPKNLVKYQVNDNYFKIPLFSIDKINKIVEKQSNGNEKCAIEITTKDSRILKFWICERNNLKFFGDLNERVFSSDRTRYFEYSFDYLKYLYQDKNYINGWNIYNVYQEFERQGIQMSNTLKLKYIKDNDSYMQCSSYPEVLIVHEKNTFNEMSDSCLHRVGNRFPVLTYYYHKNNASSCIWRASQSKVGTGIGKNRSNGDVQVIENIISLKNKLYIYDARPYVNTLTNRMKGGNSNDTVENYAKAEIILCEIDSIQKTKEAAHKVFDIIQNNRIMHNPKFWSSLDESEWFEFIQILLKYSYEIACRIRNNQNVLVHCANGTDRSTQLISLAELLLDPYYRTIKGFMVLIEKEWVSFGHPFGSRNGLNDNLSKINNPNDNTKAPIFLQWLDCVHQLQYQFPHLFEFNSEFLLFLAKNSSLNLYGTFLFDCEKDRNVYEAKLKTASVWSDVLNVMHQYTNHFYDPEHITEFIQPNYAPYKLRLWDEYFMENCVFVENDTFYLNNNKDVAFHWQLQFFNHVKLNDQKRYEQLQGDYDGMYQSLIDICEKLKENGKMEVISEDVRYQIENLIRERKEMEGKALMIKEDNHDDMSKLKVNEGEEETIKEENKEVIEQAEPLE